jgi:peptidylprolyl isomerase
VNLKPFLAASVTVLALTATACSKSNTPAASSSSTTTSASTSASSTSSGVAEKPININFAGYTIIAANDVKNPPHLTGSGDGTPTKLEIKDFVEGTGEAAKPTSTVAVRYYGFRYADGVVFDSSWSSSGIVPVTFPLTGVVAGFAQGIGGTDGVPAMKVGGRRMMVLPADLAYGASGRPPSIAPNTPLVFVVDLVEIKP